MRPPWGRGLVLVFALVGCLLLSGQARADGIGMGIFMVAGLVVVVPLLTFNVLVEAVIIRWGLQIPYRRAVWPAFLANVASLVAGFPVVIFNSWMYEAILPRDLAPYFRTWPWVAALGTAVYFVVTLVVEYGVILRWCRRKAVLVTARRTLVVVLLANVATYAVLAPLHYLATRPNHDMTAFTDRSEWALRPTTLIYYVDTPSGHLCSIGSDGEGKRELVLDDVKSYQFTPGGGLVLYRNEANELCLWKAGSTERTVCTTDAQYLAMNHATVSPDGRLVAWLAESEQPASCRLVVFDTQSQRQTGTDIIDSGRAGGENGPEIAWSTVPDLILLKRASTVQALRINADLTAVPVDGAEVPKALATVYGRFRKGTWWGGDDSSDFREDKADGTEAYVRSELFNYVEVKRNGAKFWLADDPGMIPLPRRWFREVCLLPNGREMLFDDGEGLYIMDLDRRVVGKVTDGSRFVIESPRYERKM